MPVDDIKREVSISLWLSDLRQAKHQITTRDIEHTGLAPARKELLAGIDRQIAYLKSKSATYSPLSDLKGDD